MGYGKWTADAFASYSRSMGRSYDSASGRITTDLSAQDMFSRHSIAPELDPKGVVRECRDSDDHPHSKPVILALDVTGSMGGASVEVAKSLNEIMRDMYDNVDDVEFMIMGIGDLDYDDAPIQASQFESDIRIATQLDKLYFEGGGGGNGFESYTAAWYFGLYNTELDCTKRGEKGTIITIGDEPLNPYLNEAALYRVLGTNRPQGETETLKLYELAAQKFNIYHICVDDPQSSYKYYEQRIFNTNDHCSWANVLGKDNIIVSSIKSLSQNITSLVLKSNSDNVIVDSFGNAGYNVGMEDIDIDTDEGISW